MTEINDSNGRQLSHFHPISGWMNDPNGLLYKDGIYHVFFQHNPFTTIHGEMYWGHATTADFVSWKDMPIALQPDESGECYSGCALSNEIDEKDLVTIIYTRHTDISKRHEYQCISISEDGGKTFKGIENNPVLDKDLGDFRDPKVFFDDRTGKWIMLLTAGKFLMFYSSEDLVSWKEISELFLPIEDDDYVLECPDLFQTVCDGKLIWVLLLSINYNGHKPSKTVYFTGKFDGAVFTAHTGMETLDYGPDYYAVATFSNLSGRNLSIAWMNNWLYAEKTPGEEYRGQLSIPRELAVIGDNGAFRLVQKIPNVMLEKAFPIEKITPEDKISDGDIITGSFFASGKITIHFPNGNIILAVNLSDRIVSLERENGLAGFSTVPMNVAKAEICSHESCDIIIVFGEKSVELLADGGRVSISMLYESSEKSPVIFFDNIDLQRKSLKSGGRVE